MTLPKPTLTALRKHPKAVVLLAFLKDDAETVADYDFEWFDSDEGVSIYADAANKWAAEDVRDWWDTKDGLRHVTVRVEDTKADPMVLGDINTFGGDDEWRDRIVKTILDDPTFILARAVKAAVVKAAPVVKGRKPTKAAQAAKEAKPVAKAAAVRKAAKPKAEAKAPAPVRKVAPRKAAAEDRDRRRKLIADRAAAKQEPVVKEKNAAQAFMAVGGRKRAKATV